MKNRNFTQKSRILRDTPTGKPAAWSNTDIEFPMKFNILWICKRMQQTERKE